MAEIKNKLNQTAPPNLFQAFARGFDAVANHIYLLVFPIALDLLLWLGPHIRIRRMVQVMLDSMDTVARESEAAAIPDYAEMMTAAREMWGILAERFNLFTALRTYPVGVPSLLAAQLPIQSPLGINGGFEVGFGRFLGLWLLLTLAGLLFGTLYFSITAQAALEDRFSLLKSIQDLPRAFLQVIWLTVFLAILIVVLSIPVMLVFTIIVMIAGAAGQWIILLLSGALLWFLVPLLFSSHGIFVRQADMFRSVLRGLRLAQFTLPRTSMFFLVAFVLVQGLNVVWQIPPVDTWLALIGILGHAFIYTALLAASFVYYRQTDQWLETIYQRQKTAPEQPTIINRQS